MTDQMWKDTLAGMAMQGLLAAHSGFKVISGVEIAISSYDMADEMIKERDRRNAKTK